MNSIYKKLLRTKLVKPHSSPSPSSPPLKGGEQKTGERSLKGGEQKTGERSFTKSRCLRQGGAVLLPSPLEGEGGGEGAVLKNFLVIGLLFSVLFAGCGTAQNKSDFHLRRDIDMSTITKVAVLPFDNLATEKTAGDAVRHIVVNELLLAGIVDVSMPGDAMAAAEKVGLRSPTTMTEDQIKKVGAALKVQAVIFGVVHKYGENRTGTFTAPEVSLTLMMADTQSGSVLWSVTRTSVGDSFMARHFGARAETISETTVKVVREAIATLKSE